MVDKDIDVEVEKQNNVVVEKVFNEHGNNEVGKIVEEIWELANLEVPHENYVEVVIIADVKGLEVHNTSQTKGLEGVSLEVLNNLFVEIACFCVRSLQNSYILTAVKIHHKMPKIVSTDLEIKRIQYLRFRWKTIWML